jgi:hypothetical protein
MAAAAGIVFLSLLAARKPPAGEAARPRGEYVHSIDLKSACEAELTLLPNIGKTRARRIVRRRSMTESDDPRGILKSAGLSETEAEETWPWTRRGRNDGSRP